MFTRSKRLLVIPALIIVLLEFGIVLYALPTQQNNNTGIGFASIYVYKNGRLVYYDPDDPPVNNWAYQVSALIVSGNLNPFTIKKTDGSSTSQIQPDKSTPSIWLITDDSVSYYPSSYTLSSSSYISVNVDSANVYVDTDAWTIQVSVPYTYLDDVNGNVTIYGTAYIDGNVMFFLDMYDTPITLQYNDTITVVYKFSMPQQ